ncbi:MAG: hypothetical protein A2283_05795 [Lentisphaerae bacterium RIFOXYA12_FULL_48_11]|nr:MAG: hypothetical protein A2283_05795 [Lentisphaerae bacterium RIFOXYA12_FULL_48_11]
MVSGISNSLRPLRICMLIASYAPDPEGGAEKQCRRLSQALIERGYIVEVITFRHSWRRPQVVGENKEPIIHRIGLLSCFAVAFRRVLESYVMKVVSLRHPSAMGSADRRARALAFWLVLPIVWFARFVFLIELVQLIRKQQQPFDLIHVHESGWLAGVAVVLGARLHIPVICKEATAPALGPIGYDTPFRRVWDRQRRLADAWLAQSPAIRDELNELGIMPGRIHLLSNGVVLPFETAKPEFSREVLYVGNLTQGTVWKAFDVLFDAWIRVAQARPGVRLTVVGGGDPEPWIRTLKHSGAESSVNFTGRLDDLSQIYSSAGIFVLPSRIEGMSNALLEAMSWGLPCVVSDIPGNVAVVNNESTGLVVPVGDAAAFAAAIIRLLDNPALRDSMGSCARKKIALEFDIQHVTNRLTEIYQAALGQPGSVVK